MLQIFHFRGEAFNARGISKPEVAYLATCLVGGQVGLCQIHPEMSSDVPWDVCSRPWGPWSLLGPLGNRFEHQFPGLGSKWTVSKVPSRVKSHEDSEAKVNPKFS